MAHRSPSDPQPEPQTEGADGDLRRELEETRAQLELYRRLVSHLGDVTYWHDYSSRSYRHIDPGIERLVGIPAEQFTLDQWAQLADRLEMRGEAAGLSEAEASVLMETGRLTFWDAHFHIHTPQGEERWLSDSSIPVVDEDGRNIGSFGILRDITQARQREEEARLRQMQLLRQNQALAFLSRSSTQNQRGLDAALREILQVAADTLELELASLWLFEDEHRTIRCRLHYSHSGREYPDGVAFTQQELPNYFAALEEDRVIAANEARSDPRTHELAPAYLEPRHITSMLDAPVRVFGKTVGVLCHEQVGPPRRWTQEEESFAASVADFVAVALEAEQRLSAQRALLASEGRYRELLENIQVIALTLDGEGRVTFVNKYFLDNLGYRSQDVLGREWFEEFLPEEDRAHRKATFLRNQKLGVFIPSVVNYIVTADGDRRLIEWSNTILRDAEGRPNGVASIGVDITERRRAEQELLHAQKMESIGRLAGGIAHDFNNLVGAIQGFAELAATSIPGDNPALGHLEQIRRAAWRAADLTSQLRTFARKTPIQPQVVDLNSLIQGVDRLLRRLLGPQVEMQTRLRPGIPSVRVDPSQFEQILMNLVVNAVDAMPRGGRLVIATSSVELTSGSGALPPGLVPGAYARVAVTDTGEGMPESVQSRIFEPFFTTKEVGRGTGLGLATCFGIVKQAGGHIGVQSVLGQGTTFEVLFPRVASEPDEEATAAVSQVSPTGRGQETILLAEDDPAVRQMVTLALRTYGYTVISCRDGEDALARSRQHAGEIQLLLTDLAMPRMDGRRLTREIRKERPGIRVIMTSGYDDQWSQGEDVHAESDAFIPKPCTPSELAIRIRQVLDGAAPSVSDVQEAGGL